MLAAKSLVYPVLAVLFIGLIALGIYRKTSRAVAPPLYDALTYYEKAYSVWQGLTGEKKLNPFHAPPVIRPPGSVPVTAPFGISNSKQGYQWFYFRNLFVPIVLWMAACFIAFPARSKDPADTALKYALVAALGMLPMFFNMEYNEELGIGYWGLQDTLLAAISGLALALTIRGLDRLNVLLTVAGSSLAAYTIWIKPSGALVILVVLAFWFGELVFRLCYFWNSPEQKRRTLRYAQNAFAFVLFLPALFAGIAFTSPYLSRSNIEWAKEAQTIVLGMYGGFSIAPLVVLANRSVGYIWLGVFVAVGFCAVLIAIRKEKRLLSVPAARIFLSIAALLCGFYWWYTMAGPLDRYMFPFVLMSIIGIGNPIWRLYSGGLQKTATKTVLALFLSAMALFLLIILLHGSPSKNLQVFLGINLASGGFKDSVAAGKYLRTESKSLEGSVRVYAPDPGAAAMGTAFVESFLELANHSGYNFTVIHPFPWATNSMLAVEPLLTADYILLNLDENIPPIPVEGGAKNFQEEMVVLKHFLKDLDAEDGVTKVRFGGICVIKVHERIKLRKAFFRMADSYKWRAEFYAENNKMRELAAAFDRSQDIGYRATSESPDMRLSPDSRIKMLAGGLPGDFTVEAAGPPTILIPPFSNHGKNRAYIRIELSVPSPGSRNIIYKEDAASGSKENIVGADCGRGNNVLYYEIPLTGEATSMRIETGEDPGRHSLISIEIRRAE